MRALEASRISTHSAAAALLERLLPRGRLVVRADARRGVGVELAPVTPGAWPSTCACSATFSSTAGSPAMTAGKSITSAMPSVRRRARMPAISPVPERPRGDSSALAGTQEEAITYTRSGRSRVASSIQCAPSAPSTLATSCGSHDHRRRAARDDDARELRGQELGGLQVHVRVDHPRHHRAPAGLDPLAAVVAPDAGDAAAGHGDVALQPLAREDGEHAPAGHHQVGLRVAAGDGEQVRAIVHDNPTMSSGRTGTRVSGRPVAARSAATTAGVEESVGGSPTPRSP